MESELRSKSTALELLQKIKHKQSDHIILQRDLIQSLDRVKQGYSLSRSFGSESRSTNARPSRKWEQHASPPSRHRTPREPTNVLSRGSMRQRRPSLYQSSTIIA